MATADLTRDNLHVPAEVTALIAEYAHVIDGGRFVAPRGGFFDIDGNWAVEGEGVAPDIEVRNDPAPVLAGGDPQLEAAVAEALRLLERQPVELKAEPAPPIRWRRPVAGGNGGN